MTDRYAVHELHVQRGILERIIGTVTIGSLPHSQTLGIYDNFQLANAYKELRYKTNHTQ